MYLILAVYIFFTLNFIIMPDEIHRKNSLKLVISALFDDLGPVKLPKIGIEKWPTYMHTYMYIQLHILLSYCPSLLPAYRFMIFQVLIIPSMLCSQA